MWLSKHLRISKEYVERRQGEPIRFLSNGFFGYLVIIVKGVCPLLNLLVSLGTSKYICGLMSGYLWPHILQFYTVFYFIIWYLCLKFTFQCFKYTQVLNICWWSTFFLASFREKTNCEQVIFGTYSKVLSLTLKSHWMAQWAMPKYFDS